MGNESSSLGVQQLQQSRPRTGIEYAGPAVRKDISEVPIYTWPHNQEAVRDLVLSTPRSIGLSAYPYVDPNLTLPDPRPPANGVVFDTGYMPHNRYASNAIPFTSTLSQPQKWRVK
jgi:hypothetical protein